MLLMSISPLASAEFDNDSSNYSDTNELVPNTIKIDDLVDSDDLEKSFELVKLEESPIRVSASGTSGRAPCPAIQNDGGSAGDSGNTTGTAKSLGTDPTTSIQGCVDTADSTDWYSVQISQGYNIDVVLTLLQLTLI